VFLFTFGFNDEMRKLMREKVSPILRQVVINVVVLLNCAGAHLLHAWELPMPSTAAGQIIM